MIDDRERERLIRSCQAKVRQKINEILDTQTLYAGDIIRFTHEITITKIMEPSSTPRIEREMRKVAKRKPRA